MPATIHRTGELPFTYAVETTDFDPDYIEALKRHVPSRQRKWNPDTKLWYFKPDAMETVASLLNHYFGGYQWAEDALASTAVASVEAAYSTLYLLPSAPADVVKVVYKHLAKELHPDVGGDLWRMQDINAAVAMIERCA